MQRANLPTAVAHGPLASVGMVYELPDGRRCVVTFANRGTDRLAPVRNELGELLVAFLLPGDVEPARFDDWERGWVGAELLRPSTTHAASRLQPPATAFSAGGRSRAPAARPCTTASSSAAR